jgi:hypothetical protein
MTQSDSFEANELKTGEAAPTEDGTYGTTHAESQSR